MESADIQCGKVTIHATVPQTPDNGKPSILALHGFTGSGADYLPIVEQTSDRFNWYLIDLIGHGKSDSPEDAGAYSIVSQVEYIRQIEKELRLHNYTLLGYSLGGRLALNYIVEHPNKISSLVLISSTPGIVEQSERESRIQEDKKLAESITKDGVKEFIDSWQQKSIISSQKNIRADIRNSMLEQRYQNNSVGLQNTITSMSPGLIKHQWDEIQNIHCPTLLVNGSEDGKYCDIARKVANKIPDSTTISIPSAGHCCHLEQPDSFISTLIEFIPKTSKNP